MPEAVAHLTQQRITPSGHARLTVVDDRMFAARTASRHPGWRREVEVNPNGQWLRTEQPIGGGR